jgi:hypothetical protein
MVHMKNVHLLSYVNQELLWILWINRIKNELYGVCRSLVTRISIKSLKVFVGLSDAPIHSLT